MAEEEIGEQEVDAQKEYILAKIGELVEGVSPHYGHALLEELISRMEKTVLHFHEEVSELLDTLKSRREEREEKLKTLMEFEESGEEGAEAAPLSSAEREMSEFERKLEQRTATGAQFSKSPAKPKEEEKATKTGLFRRK